MRYAPFVAAITTSDVPTPDMFNDCRDNILDRRLEESRLAHSMAEDSIKALDAAIKHHCRGEFVPEEVACLCREQAVNLDRELMRSRGEDPGPMTGDYLEDYHDSERPTSTPAR